MQVLELVTFKTKPGINHQQVLELNQAVMDKVQDFTGFLYRSLCYQKDSDTWFDVVYWQDASSAKSGQEMFMQSDACQKLMAIIDIESTQVQHADILLSSQCEETKVCG